MATSTHPVRTPAKLLFETITGATAPLADLVGPNGAVLFFMRTSTCPVCRRHLNELSEMTTEISASGRRLVIVIPDGIQAARKLGERYPTLKIVVGDAEADAQRDLGLGAKFGTHSTTSPPTSSVLKNWRFAPSWSRRCTWHSKGSAPNTARS